VRRSRETAGPDDVTVCFFGDGATAQGLWYEVMNMAALWKLPVIYACENNGYSEYTKTEEIAAGSHHRAGRGLRDRGHQVDGQDVLAVNDLTQKLVARARKGEGPFFIELRPTATTATTSATSTANTTVRRTRKRTGSRNATRSSTSAPG
jgi:acetoin:2,6-dichlorophenolindophenol oxidoreductase subunit alpha